MESEEQSDGDGDQSCLLSPFLLLPRPSDGHQNEYGVHLRPLKLPALSLRLVPDSNANSLIAVASSTALISASLRHGMEAEVNGRVCRVYASEALAGDSNVVSDVVMLSPVLYASCMERANPQAKVQVYRKASGCGNQPDVESISQVIAGVIAPFDLSNMDEYADIAKKTLCGLHVRVGDIFALSLHVWICIEAVDGDGPITSRTEFALRTSGPRSKAKVNQHMREWAQTDWENEVRTSLAEVADRLGLSLKLGVGLVSVQGLTGDVQDVLDLACIGRLIIRIDGHASVKEAMESIAHLSLLDSREAILVCDGMNGVDDDIADLLVRATYSEEAGSYMEVQQHPTLHNRPDLRVVLLCADIRDVDEKLARIIGEEVLVPAADANDRMKLLRTALIPSDEKSRDDVSETEKDSSLQDVRVEPLEDTLISLSRMSVGFSRRDVLGLAKVYNERGMEGVEETIKLFGKGQVSVDTGNITWADIGGLDYAKRQINELIKLRSIENASSSGDNGQQTLRRTVGRTGILLYGPPGTGKTLLARAMAGETGCSFMSVKGPELLDMYVGESEKNVRTVFANAIAAAPCVVFFDELDALAPARGRGSDSGGVSDRVVSQMMAELDSAHQRGDIFVVGASNRPDLVDSSLLRPGRFDKLVYVPMPETREVQAIVLTAQTRKFSFDAPIDVPGILEHAPPAPVLSGADLYALSADAWLRALKRVASSQCDENDAGKTNRNLLDLEKNRCVAWEKIDSALESWENCSLSQGLDEFYFNPKEGRGLTSEVKVSQDDFVAAAKEVQPSLSARETQQYEKLRAQLER